MSKPLSIPFLILGSGIRCKNPGYIGSENVLDSCTTVHICGGKIDDINQPVCKPLTELGANEKFDDWSHIVPWSSDRLIDKRVYNATVRDNLKTACLLDPCTNSLTDTTQTTPGAYYNEVSTCRLAHNSGLSLQTGQKRSPTQTCNLVSSDLRRKEVLRLEITKHQ